MPKYDMIYTNAIKLRALADILNNVQQDCIVHEMTFQVLGEIMEDYITPIIHELNKEEK